MAPTAAEAVPELMARCRACALVGNYEQALALHSQVRTTIKTLILSLSTSEEDRVRKAKWMGLIVELDAEIKLVQVVYTWLALLDVTKDMEAK